MSTPRYLYRYFKLSPCQNEYFIAPDGFCYCGITRQGAFCPWQFKDSKYKKQDEFTVEICEDALKGVYYSYRNDTYCKVEFNILEELTREEFDDRIKVLNCMKELTT